MLFRFFLIQNLDVYCQGVQLIGDDKNLNDYEIENEDNLLIVSKFKVPNECSMETSAGKIVWQERRVRIIVF